MVLLTVDTSCHIQVLCIDVYALISMHHGKVSCLIIVNGDSHLVRELENGLVTGHGEGALWFLKSLELHEIILRAQDSALDFSHEEVSAFQDLNLTFVVNQVIVKGYLMCCFQGGTNYFHEVGMA